MFPYSLRHTELRRLRRHRRRPWGISPIYRIRILPSAGTGTVWCVGALKVRWCCHETGYILSSSFETSGSQRRATTSINAFLDISSAD